MRGVGKVGVHHHDDRPELQGAEQRSDEVGAVPSNQHDSLLPTDPGISECGCVARRKRLHIGVGHGAIRRAGGRSDHLGPR